MNESKGIEKGIRKILTKPNMFCRLKALIQRKDVTLTTTQSRTTATGEIEIQPRVVPNASFFNFFSPPEIPKIGKLEPREDAILDEDFEIGQILHDNVILKSIYYYTGEVKGTYDDGKDYGNRKYRK